MEIRLTGTHINYLLVCHRKVWLYARHIEMETNSDRVLMGRNLHEQAFQRKEKEILVDDLIRLDFLEKNIVHDVKLTPSLEQAHRAQILYYLWYLKRQKGIEGIKGAINYPRQKRSVIVELTEAAEASVEEWMLQARLIIIQNSPPIVESPMKICGKCSYIELCWG